MSSHTKDGTLNWQKMVTDEDITSLACSDDGNGAGRSQDANVYALDSRGNTHTKYKTGEWINAVALLCTVPSLPQRLLTEPFPC